MDTDLDTSLIRHRNDPEAPAVAPPLGQSTALAEANAVIALIIREWEELGPAEATATVRENIRRILAAPRADVLEYLRLLSVAEALNVHVDSLVATNAAQFAANPDHVYSDGDRVRDRAASTLNHEAFQLRKKADVTLELL